MRIKEYRKELTEKELTTRAINILSSNKYISLNGLECANFIKNNKKPKKALPS